MLVSDDGQRETAGTYIELSTPVTAKVVVLVLNWNGCQETLACLATLAQQADANSEVVVVDNGSVDDSRTAIEKHFPNVKLICTGRNLGFAGGNNVGLRYILDNGLAQYILVLNNDTLAPPNLVTALVETASVTGEQSIIAPLILDGEIPPRVWYNGARWDPRTCTFTVDSHEYGSGPLLVETQIAVGCALFAPVEAFRRVGLFDERLFLMHEESDWCFRAARAGYKFYVTRSTVLTHLGSVSFGGAGSAMHRYFDIRNRLYFAQWNLTTVQLARTFALCLMRALSDAVGLLGWAPPRGWRWSPRQWYWALRSYLDRPETRRRVTGMDPQIKSQFAALFDYVRRRTGDCPAFIRNG